MKATIRDKRHNPRVIYIDGKRYILPEGKEVVKEMSRMAFLYLSQCPWLEVKPYTVEETISVEEVENPIVEGKKETCIECIKEETSIKEVEEALAHSEIEEVQAEEGSIVEVVEEEKTLNSYSKKELRTMVEEKGGDSTGMSKANMIDWLKSNP